jgi:uncharacterized damage-inducible protein DinB
MKIINKLIDSRNHTLAYFDLDEISLSKSYGKGKWSVRQTLIHLSDAESVMLERLKRVIAEPKQVLWAFDQDLWCEKLDYYSFPLDLAQNQFKYYVSHGHKTFVHSETGLRTLKDEFDKIVWHCQSHLEHIQKALTIPVN